MGEALITRRGGGGSSGGVKTGNARATTENDFVHDDFVGAKEVMIFTNKPTLTEDVVWHGFFKPDDSRVEYLSYGDIGFEDYPEFVSFNATEGNLHTLSLIPFDTTSTYFYVAIY